MQWRSPAGKKGTPTLKATHAITGDLVRVARRNNRAGIVSQVCQCTTEKCRDEPDEEQRWLNAERMVVAVAKAYCCNEIGVDVLYQCIDEQVKIVPVKRISAVSNATIAETVWTKLFPRSPHRHQKPVDVVMSAPKKRKLLNARSNASRKSSKTVVTSSSCSPFEGLAF